MIHRNAKIVINTFFFCLCLFQNSLIKLVDSYYLLYYKLSNINNFLDSLIFQITINITQLSYSPI